MRFVRARHAALTFLLACATAACAPSATPTPPAAPAPTQRPAPTVAATVSASPTASDAQQFPDVIAVDVRADGERFDFDVTLSSPYDTPQRYADAFRVLGSDGVVFGERVLLHDHQFEQPFTRDLYDVAIPLGITSVIVQGRDQRFGYGGITMTVGLPGR
jgi:hypothetical protein